jgi:hypothetical protein
MGYVRGCITAPIPQEDSGASLWNGETILGAILIVHSFFSLQVWCSLLLATSSGLITIFHCTLAWLCHQIAQLQCLSVASQQSINDPGECFLWDFLYAGNVACCLNIFIVSTSTHQYCLDLDLDVSECPMQSSTLNWKFPVVFGFMEDSWRRRHTPYMCCITRNSFWGDLSLFQGCSSYLDLQLWHCNGIPIQAPIWWVYCQRFWLVPFLLCNPSLKELKYQRFHLRFAACPSISKSAFSVVKISPSFVSRKSIMKCQFSVHFHFQPYSPQLKVGWWKVQCRTFTCC